MEPTTESPADLPSWDELPMTVRKRVLVWAATALGTEPTARVPAALRPVARFHPNKRARLGAAALATALAGDESFRGLVAAYVRANTAGAADPDPVAAVGAAYLLALPETRDLLSGLPDGDEAASLRAENARLRGQVHKLQAELDRAAAAVPTQPVEPTAELDKLRGRLREQGTKLRELRDELERRDREQATAESAVAAELAALREEARLATERADSTRARADRAEEQLRLLRANGEQQAGVLSRRTELLLDTLRAAVDGLRAELRPPGGGVDPAEAVERGLPAAGAAAGGRAVDSRMVDAWLSLPQVHLVVDGYNITKTGYGDLTLADQRDRLVRDLAALAARTGAEVTVVFDGAAVVGHQPVGRKVRVLFSPPGIIADEVIRRLVAAEPRGRVLLVATADREILDHVTAGGARPVPPRVLLELTGH